MRKVVSSLLLLSLLACGFNEPFYEHVSGIRLPAHQVLESVDNADYLTISTLRVAKSALQQLIETHEFEPATASTLTFLYGTVYLQKLKPEWRKSSNLYIKSGENSKQKHHWVYVIDMQKGVLWAQISYPDWADT